MRGGRNRRVEVREGFDTVHDVAVTLPLDDGLVRMISVQHVAACRLLREERLSTTQRARPFALGQTVHW